MPPFPASRYCRLGAVKTPEQLRACLAQAQVELPFDETVQPAPDGPLAQACTLPGGFTVGNRFAAQPMEGWDGTLDGAPSELTFRRWRRFGSSGAKLIWGGEAAAVRADGRANPNQLWLNRANLPAFRQLRQALVQAHAERFGRTDDLYIGLQLTHSGRYARPGPDHRPAPVIAYHHPYLDARLGLPPTYPLITDAEIELLIEDYLLAAELAAAAGFHFVDIKCCHGYLGHEFLSAHLRPGPFGGSFENRARFVCEIVSRLRARLPDLAVGVRLSGFDMPPFRPLPGSRLGEPELLLEADPHCWFGSDPANPFRPDPQEAIRLVGLLSGLGVTLFNITAGSPYYNPHIQRPAYYPPSDGYLPPEDPLVGVARQVHFTAHVKERFPLLPLVGSAYTYLQDWLPNVAQAVVRRGWTDFVGLGRMLLAYPELPADVLAGRPLDRRRLCRTFSDCTSAPRQGLVSGCYPLDPYYTGRPEAASLAEAKQRLRQL
jgi:NADPH2 dehydrogenase